MPKAGWRIIFVFPTNAEEHNYTESFSLNKKCLMYKTNTEMLLVLIMLSLTSFYVSIYSSRHSWNAKGVGFWKPCGAMSFMSESAQNMWKAQPM